MLLNMALVWLMIVFSKWYITYLFEMIFWNYFHSLKKGLCWPSVREYYHFEFGSAQSLKAIFYALRFEMIYDFHLQMSRKNFVHKIIFVRKIRNILLTKIPYNLYFSYTAFYARLGPYPCVEIKFLEKGDGLLCQILIILQC